MAMSMPRRPPTDELEDLRRADDGARRRLLKQKRQEMRETSRSD